MLNYDIQYKDILKNILENGSRSPNRTGTDTIKIFDANLSANVSNENGRAVLPALTLRKVYPRSIWYELFWMLSGSLDARILQAKGIKIWDGNTTREFLNSRGLHDVEEGFIGKAGYGSMFRDFHGVDQFKDVVKGLITDPDSRRHYISLWDCSRLNDMALPCCHVAYNFMVINNTLNLKFFQRSSDFVLAGNANFMFSAFLLNFVARLVGMEVGTVSHSITDCHIYSNLIEAAEHIVGKDPIDHVATYEYPLVRQLKTVEDVDTHLDDIIASMMEDSVWEKIQESLDYQSHEALPKELLVMTV